MGQAGQTLKCPHCGAENPRSLLITMCRVCKQNLSAAAGAPRPTSTSARPPAVPAGAASPPAMRRPQMPPPPTTAPRTPQPGRRPDSPGVAQPVGRPELGSKPQEAAVSCLILLFALAAFGIAMGIVMAISK